MATNEEIIDKYQKETKIRINQRQRKEILELLSKYKQGVIEKE